MIGVLKLTTHSSRHSYAEIAKQKTGGNVAAVSDSLDHSSIAITTAYFNDATQAENDALVDTVFGD